MTARKANPKLPPIPTDEPGQQPTPDSDALVEVEGASAGAGLSLVDVANALRATGASSSREQLDRAFTRDKQDIDVGYEEGIRACLLMNFQGMAAMDSVLNHTKAMAAIRAETTVHARDNMALHHENVLRSGDVFHSSLIKAYALETDNEVLSTIALAKIVDNLAQKVGSIEAAILSVKT